MAERVFQGTPVSPGIALGALVKFTDADVPMGRLPAHLQGSPDEELVRFETAIHAARDELRDLAREVRARAGDHTAAIFRFHSGMLEDPEFSDRIRALIANGGLAAEDALHAVVESTLQAFESIRDPTIRERSADVKDLSARLMRLLLGRAHRALAATDQILLVRELAPSLVARLAGTVQGFLAERGEPTSHAAILARSMGIPAIVNLEGIFDLSHHEERVAMNAGTGRVVLMPADETERALVRARNEGREREEVAFAGAHLPSVTTDGVSVSLLANLATPEDVVPTLAADAAGVGLLRTEFLFMAQDRAPSEDEQFEIYRELAARLEGRPLTIRTLDIGGDKQVPYLPISPGKNPLGLRGIRYSLTEYELFKTQLRAIYRAGAGHDVRVMFPMVSGLSELEEVDAVLGEVRTDLEGRGVPFRRDLPRGTMVEVPSLALTLEDAAERADFFSVGSNDLVSFLLAVDRYEKALAGLYDPWHPAVMRLLREIAESAERAGRPITFCGEIGAEPSFFLVLLGLGFRAFSVNPRGIPRIRALARTVSLAECRRHAEALRELKTPYALHGYERETLRPLVHDRLAPDPRFRSREEAVSGG